MTLSAVASVQLHPNGLAALRQPGNKDWEWMAFASLATCACSGCQACHVTYASCRPLEWRRNWASHAIQGYWVLRYDQFAGCQGPLIRLMGTADRAHQRLPCVRAGRRAVLY